MTAITSADLKRAFQQIRERPVMQPVIWAHNPLCQGYLERDESKCNCIPARVS